ncbi:MAG: TlpA family protein disulfide reductase [Bacteroidota bacterium]
MKIFVSILLFALPSAAISQQAVQLNGQVSGQEFPVRAPQLTDQQAVQLNGQVSGQELPVRAPQLTDQQAVQLNGGQDVLINGSAPGAAGEYIQLYTLPDPVTGRKKLIQSIAVDTTEKFFLRMDCDSLCWIIFRLGVNEYQLLVQSGESYQPVLPGYKEMTRVTKLDPFFEYKSVHLRLGKGDNPNNAIRAIDSLYYKYVNQVTGAIYLGEKLPDSDTLLSAFSRIEESLEGEYEKRYFSCRYSLLSMISVRDISPGRDELDLINSSYSPRMPAYADLVKQVFNGWLIRLANNDNTGEIRHIINSGNNYHAIVKLIIDQGSIRDTSLLEFVLLDNLYSEYYKGGFRKEAVEYLIEDMSSEAINKYNRNLAARALWQIRKLKPGNRPPPFSLPGRDGLLYTPDSLRGKYSILVFGSADLPETGFELDILNSWVNDFRDSLAVAVILVDEDFESSFRKGGFKKYDFIFLDGSASDKLLDDYEISYLPAFYFLDREAKLLLSPSVMPSENLRELIISRYLKGPR